MRDGFLFSITVSVVCCVLILRETNSLLTKILEVLQCGASIGTTL